MKILSLVVDSYGPLAPGTCFEPGGVSGTEGPLLIPSTEGKLGSVLVSALRFALYGQGAQGEGQVDASAKLSLDFELGGETLRVKRAPAKTGLTARKGSEALLWRRTGLTNVSKDGELVARGRRDVDAKLAELLSLSAESFSQSIVLKVGELSRVLGQGAPLRKFVEAGIDLEPALRLEQELERALGVIEAEADALQQERREALVRATEVVEPGRAVPLPIEDFETHARLLEGQLTDLRSSLMDLKEGEEKARGLLVTAAERQARLDQLEATKLELDQVEKQGPATLKRERELERAMLAADFSPREAELSDKQLLRELEKVARSRDKASQSHEGIVADLTAAEESLQRARAHETELSELRTQLAAMDEYETVGRVLQEASVDKQAASGRAEHQVGLLAKKQANHHAATKKLDKLRSARDKALARLGEDDAARIEGLRADVDGSRLVVRQASRLAELIDARKAATKNHATGKIRLDRLRSERERAERDLEHLTHGAGETGEADRASSRMEEIDQEVRRITFDADEQLDQVTHLGREVLQLRRLLGTKAYTELRRLVADAKLAEEALEVAGTPAETLARRETELREQVVAEAALVADVAGIVLDAEAAAADEESSSALVAELSERLPAHLREKGALAKESHRLTTAIAARESESERAEAALVRSQAEFKESAASLATSQQTVLEVQARVDEAMGTMGKELVALGFASFSDYSSATRSKAEVRELKSLIEGHHAELSAAREAYQRARGETDVPVLREKDRKKWEREEWERRQAERTERLQAERVRRDRDLLESLQQQLASCVSEAVAEEAILASDVRELEGVAAGVDDVTSRLLALREQHAAAATLADSALGTRGKGQGFVSCYEASAQEEAALRAASWTRWLSCDAFDLRRDAQVRGSFALDLREIDGRRLQTLGELHGERKFLVSLALCLGLRDAALTLRGERAPETIILEGGLEELPPAQAAVVKGMLERLAAVGRSVVVFHPAEEAPAGLDTRVAHLPMAKRAGVGEER